METTNLSNHGLTRELDLIENERNNASEINQGTHEQNEEGYQEGMDQVRMDVGTTAVQGDRRCGEPARRMRRAGSRREETGFAVPVAGGEAS